MLWFQRVVALWRRNVRIEELVEQLSASCAVEVRRRLSERVRHMSLHEIRGYVRARSAAVVRQAAIEAGQRQGLAPDRLAHLHVLVLNATTQRVYSQLGGLSPRIPLRRAA